MSNMKNSVQQLPIFMNNKKIHFFFEKIQFFSLKFIFQNSFLFSRQTPGTLVYYIFGNNLPKFKTNCSTNFHIKVRIDALCYKYDDNNYII